MSLLLRTRRVVEKEEDQRLAPCATRSRASRGRLWAEEEPVYRTRFQRDRDRILHSTAFRRLQYKTQVYVHHEGDHYRNRLTHTLEGAQIARTIARALRLNEDLAEAVALAHDLGHTPFGHAGERVLDELLAGRGGFDHNRQCLRVVDLLEQRHPERSGLNLCDETREGILKHGFEGEHPLPLPELRAQRHLESQVADAADEIAYMNHDLDDALRSGLLEFDMLAELPMVGELERTQRARLGEVAEPVRRARLVAGWIDRMVAEVIRETAERISARRLDSPDAVRDADAPAVGYGPEMTAAKREMKSFLFDRVYHHPRVVGPTREAESVVRELFEVLAAHAELLPESVRARFGEEGRARALADYVAGMTDRFARAEHARLVSGDPHSGERTARDPAPGGAAAT